LGNSRRLPIINDDSFGLRKSSAAITWNARILYGEILVGARAGIAEYSRRGSQAAFISAFAAVSYFRKNIYLTVGIDQLRRIDNAQRAGVMISPSIGRLADMQLDPVGTTAGEINGRLRAQCRRIKWADNFIVIIWSRRRAGFRW